MKPHAFDIASTVQSRRTAKAYDSTKIILDKDIEKVKTLLRFSPSSTNAQPWHFILAGTREGKAQVAKSAEGIYSFNQTNMLNASHVVVFCSKLVVDEAHLLKVIEQEDKDGRYPDVAAKDEYHTKRCIFRDLHRNDWQDEEAWIEKQVYLNLGQFLLGVAALGIDATAMEGFDPEVLDKEFGLTEKGYKSAVVVALGYHHEVEDYNAKLPKSRLGFDQILTEI